MRPVELTMRAFGPFVEETQLDFRSLQPDEVLLISGVTGAGKTSIFDAICYALYGQASGQERERRMLRSSQARLEEPTEVEFSFTHGGQTYRIRRRMAGLQPKRRGDGLRESPEEVTLYRGDQALAKSSRDCQRAVEELLGLTAAQFTRCLMLPQGAFVRLLSSKDREERKAMLRQIFNTRVFERFEKKLNEAYKLEKEGLVQWRRAGEALFEKLPLSEEDRDYWRPRWEPEGEKLGALLRQELEEQAQTLKEETATLRHLEEELPRLLELQASLGELVKIQEAWLQEQEEWPKLERSLEERRARFHELQAQEAQWEEGRKQLLSLETELQNYVLVRERQEELKGLERLLAQARACEGRAQDQAEACRQSLEHQRLEASQLRAKLEQQEDLAAQQERLGQRRQGLEELLRLLAAWEEQGQACLSSYQSLSHQEAELQDLASVHETLYQALLRGQAQVLAQGLEQGQPCPVCGSREHPKPARSRAETPSEEEVEAARRCVEDFQAKLQKKRETWAAEEARRKQLRDDYVRSWGRLGLGPALEVEESLSEIRERHQELLQAALQELREAQEALRAELAKRQTWQARHAELEALQAELSAEREQLLQAQQQAAQDRSRLEADLEAKTKALAELQAKFSWPSYEEAQAEQARLRQAEEAYKQALEAARREQEARSLDARAARTRQEERARTYKETWAQCQALLECPEPSFASRGMEEKVREILGPAPELGSLEDCRGRIQGLARAQNFLTGIIGRDRVIIEKLRLKQQEGLYRQKRGEELLADWVELLARGREVQQNYSRLERLYGIYCGGQGLENFVLNYYFERLVEAANRRFCDLSKGRLYLQRRAGEVLEERRSSRELSLSLDVYDSQAGKLRAVETLSGGESFLAALSMALGLTELAQAEAGGRQFDCLFIDEGFGSLDQESLELAFSVLTDMAQEGKLIGIISHVEQLKDWVWQELRVEKCPDGSAQLKLRTGGAAPARQGPEEL